MPVDTKNDAVTSLTTTSGAENTVLSDERYRRAAAAGGVGVWHCDLATEEIYVDPVLKQMLGYQDHEIRNELEDCRRLVHPDDVPVTLLRGCTTAERPAPPTLARCLGNHCQDGVAALCTTDENGQCR